MALVAVAVVVLWARLSDGAADSEDGAVEPVPSTLVGGISPAEVPQAIVAEYDVPVIGAARLDELPAGVQEACDDSFGGMSWDAGQPELEYAIATPDAISTSLVGTGENVEMDMGGPGGPDRFRLRCTARAEGDGWIADSSGFEPIFDEETVEPGFGGMGVSCCDENGLSTATGVVQVPADATWGLQDRNGWYLAHPVDGQDQLAVMWKFRENQFGGGPPQTTLTFLDDSGAVIAEAFVGGNF